MPEQLDDGIVMAFDFGLKRIGVAVGQTVTKTANPHTMIKAKDGVPNWDDVGRLIKEWKPIALVVGIPLNMDGTEQPMSQRAKKFANRLADRFKLPVYPVDERLTTRVAREAIFQQGGYKALQEDSVDAMAAKIMLEAWLSSLS